MAWTPWLTGDVIMATKLNQMTRCAGAWNAAGQELYLPAAAFHPAIQYGTSKPHTWYGVPSGGDWRTVPMDPTNGTGCAVCLAIPKQWNGQLKGRTWYLDLGGGSHYSTTVVFGTSLRGASEPIGSGHTAWAQLLPATGTQYGLYVSPWTGYLGPGAAAEGDLLWILVHRWGWMADDTATSDWPFVGLSLSFQTHAVNDA